MEKRKTHRFGLLPAMQFPTTEREFSRTQNQTTLDNVLKMVGSFPFAANSNWRVCRLPRKRYAVGQSATAIRDYLTAKGETKHTVVKEYGNIRTLNQCNCANPHIICSEEKRFRKPQSRV